MSEESKGQLDSMDATRRAIIQLIQDLDEPALNWNPLPGEANSIYAIVAHLCTSEQGMIHGRIGGLEFERLVDNALQEARGNNPQTLIDMIEEVGQQTREVLGDISDEKLREPIQSGNRRPRSAREWIHLHIRHMSDHLGHIELTKQFYEAGIVK
tara:strand:+ start:212 stop:676 length:465 start_codon:yes stop_codon:yes gene_type:complete